VIAVAAITVIGLSVATLASRHHGVTAAAVAVKLPGTVKAPPT